MSDSKIKMYTALNIYTNILHKRITYNKCSVSSYCNFLHVIFYSFQLVDQKAGITDNTEPLKPRFSLTANKCESNVCEDFHLMIFGGTTDVEYEAFAETTLGKHVVDYFTAKQCIDFFSTCTYFYTVDSFDFDNKTMRVNKL